MKRKEVSTKPQFNWAKKLYFEKLKNEILDPKEEQSFESNPQKISKRSKNNEKLKRNDKEKEINKSTDPNRQKQSEKKENFEGNVKKNKTNKKKTQQTITEQQEKQNEIDISFNYNELTLNLDQVDSFDCPQCGNK